MQDPEPLNGAASSSRRTGPAEFGRGELSPRDAAEFRNLKKMIQSRGGLDMDGYKERVLRRRIAVRMRARNVTTFGAYGHMLQKDAVEFDRLMDTVTINVSKFFRNASTWVLVRDTVIPDLFAIDAPEINIWSAGSAAGEEAYSVAILLTQHAEETGANLDRFRIRASDIDEDVLEQAARAEYGSFAFTEMSATTRDRWFEGPGRDRLKEEIRRMVEFDRRDLLSADFPQGQHLVLCRNVLIYFERPIQHALFEKFHAALVPGGYLQLGKVETLFGARSGMFDTVSARERLFRRS